MVNICIRKTIDRLALNDSSQFNGSDVVICL